MAQQPAILNGARLNGFRLGYLPADLARQRSTQARILLAGVDARARVAGLTVRDVLNDAPNTCALTLDGTESPLCEQTLRVLIDSNTPKLLFNGALQSVDLSYEGRPHQVAYPCNAIDDTARANRSRPFGTWTNVSATDVAIQILQQFAPGFTYAHVQNNLPPVSIILDGTEGMSGALKQITTQIGGYFYFEDTDLHLFIVELTQPPDPIDMTPGRLLDNPPITISRDDSQLRTAQFGRGHGEALLSDINADETILPVANADAWFGTVAPGGRAIALSQRLQYTGVQAPTGAGSLVGPGAGPTVAPNVAAVAGAGLPDGTYKYAYTDVTAAGESIPSPLAQTTTGMVSGPPLPEPTTIVGGSPATGAGLSAGTRQYAFTFTNGAGETLPGPVVSLTTPPVPAPTTAPRWTGGTVIGSLPGDGGHAPFHHWAWAVTFVMASGETAYGPRMNIGNGLVASVGFPVTDVPLGPSGTTSRRIYRTQMQTGATPADAANASLAAPLYLEGGISDNTTINYTCGMVDDATLGGPSAANAAYGVMNLTSIAAGPAGTTGRKLYRSGAGPLRLVATFGDNTTTTYQDTTPDGSLGAPAPTSNTTPVPVALNQINVTGIATGSGGTTARRIYRTQVNGTQLKVLATIPNNTSTVLGIDTASDAALGANAPTADTSGLVGSAVAGNVLAGATQIPTSGVAPFPSSGWALFGQQVVRYRSIGHGSPAAPPSLALSAGTGLNLGTYKYGIRFVTAQGTTDISPLAQATTMIGTVQLTSVIAARPVPTVPAMNSVPASLSYPSGSYSVVVTFLYADGMESLPSPSTQWQFAGTELWHVYNIAIGGPNVTGRRVYGMPTGGTWGANDGALGGFANNTATAGDFSWPARDAGLHVPSVAAGYGAGSTTLHVANVTNFPASGSITVGGMTVNYTGITIISGTLGLLTGCTGITAPIAIGATVVTTSGVAQAYQRIFVGLPVGPAGTTGRSIYRTVANGPDLRFAGTIPDNTTAGYVDSLADASLGAVGVAGDSSGLFANSLTDIPTSGPGSLGATILYGAPIGPVAALTGVTGLTLPLVQNTQVNVWVQRYDLDAISEQAAVDRANGIVPADGIYEGPILVDERRGEASMNALCDANLALYSRPIVTVRYACRDTKTKSGKTVRIDLDSPAIHETLTIQEVTITEIDIAVGLLPRFSVVASNVRFSLDDILRRLLTSTDAT